jgi:hypothetical protein
MKVLLNKCYGGFGLSEKVYHEMGWEWDNYGFGYSHYEIHDEIYDEMKMRTDPKLIAAIEKIGLEESSGICAKIFIEEIDDDTSFEIDGYDGYERLRYC